MATNHVYCSYQEVIDLHTEGDHVTVIGIHTPTGDTPRRMFKGLFDQFKQYKYNGCSVKMVPAARLPVDPLQVGTEPGQVYETPMDPRDALNPLMFHGCHGDDMGTILNKLYGTDNEISDSLDGLDAPSSGAILPMAFKDVLERLYYKALTDRTWKKAGAQRGFMKSGLRPLVYSLAANRQIMPGTKGPAFTLGENGEIIQNLGDPMDSWQLEDESLGMPVNKSTLQLMTPRLTSLGWIDTKNVLTTPQNLQVSTLTDAFVAQENYTELPKVFMGVILLPPAYGVEQYFRMIINHSFTFRKFRGISFKPEMPNVPSYYDANDDLFNPDKYDGEDDPEPEPEPEPTDAYYVGAIHAADGTGVTSILVNGETLDARQLVFKDHNGNNLLGDTVTDIGATVFNQSAGTVYSNFNALGNQYDSILTSADDPGCIGAKLYGTIGASTTVFVFWKGIVYHKIGSNWVQFDNADSLRKYGVDHLWINGGANIPVLGQDTSVDWGVDQ